MVPFPRGITSICSAHSCQDCGVKGATQWITPFLALWSLCWKHLGLDPFPSSEAKSGEKISWSLRFSLPILPSCPGSSPILHRANSSFSYPGPLTDVMSSRNHLWFLLVCGRLHSILPWSTPCGVITYWPPPPNSGLCEGQGQLCLAQHDMLRAQQSVCSIAGIENTHVHLPVLPPVQGCSGREGVSARHLVSFGCNFLICKKHGLN